MLERFAEYLTDRMIANETIPREKAALYSFGLLQGMRTILEAGMLLITGFLLGLFWQGIVILLSFVMVRMYAGGYHAATVGQCAWKTWLLFTGVLPYLKFVPCHPILQGIVLLAAAIFMYWKAPIQDEHKPLEEYEIKKYRKKAAVFLGIDLAVYILGYLLKITDLSRSIVMGIVMLSVVLVSGYIKNLIRQK